MLEMTFTAILNVSTTYILNQTRFEVKNQLKIKGMTKLVYINEVLLIKKDEMRL